LVIGAALLLNSFWRLRQVNPGFKPERVAALGLAIPQSKYREWHQVMNFQTQLLERFNQLPGVQSAAIAYDHPLRTSWLDSFTIEGRPAPEPGQAPAESFRPVSPEYFRTLGIELVRGREFTAQDDPAHPGVVIINEALERRYFSGEEPLGRRLRISTPARIWPRAMPVSFEIIGVVRDVKARGLEAESEPAFYLSVRQFPTQEMAVLVRTQGEPLEMAAALRQAVWSLDRNQPIAQITAMEKVLSDGMAQPRFNTLLMGLFGALALGLAAVGIYGLLAYSVAQRTHEIGVRLALGAQRRDVLRLVVGQGMLLALLGIGLGVAGAFGLTRLMRSRLFGVSATDPLTFAGIALLLAGVALVACYLPARRATRVDPMVALRWE
jgi:putative ABC transport system permease protein